ncbi:30S ribosomal protein S6 [Parenemella sanctibonifatiensis]|uniref:Small ribosomal subunit protein bS6 n=1 Tax=Parenemella sanctibonifatiensis TaxID=2016505 RepID=A0A255DXP6_9ACTN|nr:30S ribosomal protein S6 [Parenemella sanctibonifatiensis]OYN84098.1 30S ribosomal protein S6 [Parenemella sanctibonifatiensis]OYN90190.1 30S ribosomal protein S6 [Parenemella sanctibonifatiensis]
MRKYEVMVIVDPVVDERQVQGLLENHLKVITESGGTVDELNIWGRRKLAYEIDKKPEGVYAVIELTCEPDAVKELDRFFRINEQIMRTKVLRPELHN